jgi:hypothetical protein
MEISITVLRSLMQDTAELAVNASLAKLRYHQAILK